jgi:hypothetical protein
LFSPCLNFNSERKRRNSLIPLVSEKEDEVVAIAGVVEKLDVAASRWREPWRFSPR